LGIFFVEASGRILQSEFNLHLVLSVTFPALVAFFFSTKTNGGGCKGMRKCVVAVALVLSFVAGITDAKRGQIVTCSG
jgi:hypothetical protein